MKSRIMMLIIGFIVTKNVVAGFPPETTCSNHQNTVQIDINSQVVIYRSPSKYSYSGEIPMSELNLFEKLIVDLPEEISGCTSRKIKVKNIRITRKSGAPMPGAYNRNETAKGAFEDVFICETSSAWVASPCPPVMD